MDLGSEISRADGYRTRVGELVSGEYADDPKVLLLISYTDLVIEHHGAIMLLLAQKRYGSAFALVRIQYEAFMRANWVIGCATDQQIQKIVANEFEFPGMKTLASACDTAFETGQFFDEIKRQGWEPMNSYTHSGIRQLSRRFHQGKVQPNYCEGEIKEVINATTTTVLLVGRLFCETVGKRVESEEVQRLTFEFASEPVRQVGDGGV